jgi:hypothetical protein
VAPAAFTWSDLGAWDAIWEASVRDAGGNVASGDIHLINTRNVLARSTGPFVGAIGVEDLLIVAEPDAVLVCRRDDAQAVKTLVDVLKAGGRDIAHRHAIAFSGGVERQPVTSTPEAVVQLWRMEAGAVADLPAGSLQVLTARWPRRPKPSPWAPARICSRPPRSRRWRPPRCLSRPGARPLAREGHADGATIASARLVPRTPRHSVAGKN